MNKKIKKTVLITGGTGNLGSRVIYQLVNDYNIICLYRTRKSISKKLNLTDINKNITFINYKNIDYKKIILKYKVTIIFHSATNYGLDHNDEGVLESNLLLPLKILRASIECGCKYFINTDTILEKDLNSYSLSKKHFRDWLFRYSNKIKTINLRYEHFYGPNDDQTKFITWIISQMKINKKEIMMTKGDQERDFIFIDDAVDATSHVFKNLEKLHSNFDIDIGTGNLYKIKDIVNEIKTLMQNKKTTLQFGAIKYRKNEIMKTRLNLDVMYKKLNWKPKYSLTEGLILSIKGTKK